MPTNRDAMDAATRAARFVHWIAFSVVLLCLAWMVGSQSADLTTILIALSAAIGGVTSFYVAAFRLKCPSCQTRWYHYAFISTPVRLNRRIRFCPFCGVSLDHPL